MSKARQKGTTYENHVRDTYLQKAWPMVERAPLKGTLDYGDFINVNHVLIEARNRKTWALPAWIRGVYSKLEKRHGSRYHPWMIVFKADKRTELDEDYALLPMWWVSELVQLAAHTHVLRRGNSERTHL